MGPSDDRLSSSGQRAPRRLPWRPGHRAAQSAAPDRIRPRAIADGTWVWLPRHFPNHENSALSSAPQLGGRASALGGTRQGETPWVSRALLSFDEGRWRRRVQSLGLRGSRRREAGVRPVEQPAMEAGVRPLVRDALVAESEAGATPCRIRDLPTQSRSASTPLRPAWTLHAAARNYRDVAQALASRGSPGARNRCAALGDALGR